MKIAIVALLCLVIGWVLRWLYAKARFLTLEQKSKDLKNNAVKEAETLKKEMLLDVQELVIREKKALDKEIRDRKEELKKLENRLQSKEDNLEKKLQGLETKQRQLDVRGNELEEEFVKYAKLEQSLVEKLEKIASLTADEAKTMLIESIENEARKEAKSLVTKIETESKEYGEKRARELLVGIIQRLASEVSADVTVSTIGLPSDEMKGRIIGREGRNIRMLETLTGVDVIIDDTPEALVVSSYDPVRRAIAKESIEKLVSDGRIHPTRIEEVVQKTTKEVHQKAFEEAEKVLFALGINNMSNEGIKALGRLYFRTSYGQNILNHSLEVANIAGMIASELGANRQIAIKAALLHDIGKGIQTESDANHAEIGAEFAKKIGEKEAVVHAILAHHYDVEPSTVEAIIVQVADAISAARPGARREIMDSYVKRLENLEKIATSYAGVERAFAIQAGRELRIIVNNEEINDDQMKDMGRDIATQVENELKYPGRIRITLVRESRIVEYAR